MSVQCKTLNLPTNCGISNMYESDVATCDDTDLKNKEEERNIHIAFSATNLQPPCGCPHLPFFNVNLKKDDITHYLSKVTISYNGVTFTADKHAVNHEIITSIFLKKMFPGDISKLMSEYFGIYHWLIYSVERF